MKKIKNPVVKTVYDVLLATGFEGSYIFDIVGEEYSMKINIGLPIGSDSEDFENIVLNNLKEEFKALDVKIGKRNGKVIEVILGMRKLDKGNFNVSKDNVCDYLSKGLEIKLPSAFGDSFLDFEDGCSCHMLNGGTTRMGKTCMLLHLCCVLFLQTKGDIKFYICSSKKKDFFPLFDIDQFSFASESNELLLLLGELMEEYDKRKNMLDYHPLLRKCKDSKDVRKYHIGMYHHFKPIFLVIDEFADYSNDKDIMMLVEHLVRKAGYINIHVIITTQRADARTTIPPAIKCCLSARICFTTTDINNSIVILDQEGAEKLGHIEGRAIFLDGGLNIVQVPFMDTLVCDEIMEQFRGVKNDKPEIKKGSINPNVTEKVSNMFKKSDSKFTI